MNNSVKDIRLLFANTDITVPKPLEETHHMTIPHIQAVVLAAGKSSRFKASTSKLLAPLCGKPIITYILKLLESLSINTLLVTNPENTDLLNCITDADIKNVTFVTQTQARGTGDALASAYSSITAAHVLVLNGDVPLINDTLIETLITHHATTNAAITFCTSTVAEPFGYGRVLEESKHIKIIEERDCTEVEKKINRINAGIYLFERSFLDRHLATLTPHNASGEIYITDLVTIASNNRLLVQTLHVPYDLIRGVNTLSELVTVERIKRFEIMDQLMEKGVRFIAPESNILDADVTIGFGSTIYPGAQILSGTIIGSYVAVEGYSIIKNSMIYDQATIHPYSFIENSTVHTSAQIGPFAHVHRNTTIHEAAIVGNFVEAQQTTLGKKSKAKHLTYLGKTEIGDESNIGAGTITCNYDGKHKHQTTIGNRVFIGSNNSLIAPITIHDGSFTAAGSTITESVPPDSLAIARARQETKIGYATRLQKKSADTTQQPLSLEKSGSIPT